MLYSTLVRNGAGAWRSRAGSHPLTWTYLLFLQDSCLTHQSNGGSSNTVYPHFLPTVWVPALFSLNLEIWENFSSPNPEHCFHNVACLVHKVPALQGACPLLGSNVAHVCLPTVSWVFPNLLNNISSQPLRSGWKYLFSCFCCWAQDI